MTAHNHPASANQRATRGFYFEDFNTGDVMLTAGRTITEHDIGTFAGLTGDADELHTNEEYARNTAFGGRIAHGMLGLAIMHGLLWRTLYLEGTGIAMLGWDRVAFRAPLRIGDTVQNPPEGDHKARKQQPTGRRYRR